MGNLSRRTACEARIHGSEVEMGNSTAFESSRWNSRKYRSARSDTDATVCARDL